MLGEASKEYGGYKESRDRGKKRNRVDDRGTVHTASGKEMDKQRKVWLGSREWNKTKLQMSRMAEGGGW